MEDVDGRVFEKPLQLALVGNPNSGKTTLFNALTGLRQRIGNYPGVTVTTTTGSMFFDQKSAYITDLPGTYSLAASSLDEKVVHDYINGNLPHVSKPDVLVCVIDATHLSKNLFLASQLAEHHIPMVIALSFWDSASKHTHFELGLLTQRLGVPIVPINAAKGEGIAELKSAILEAHANSKTMTRILWDAKIQEVMDAFRKEVEQKGEKLSDAEVQRYLFDSYVPSLHRVKIDPVELKKIVDFHRAKIRQGGFHPHTAEAVLHSRHLNPLLIGVVSSGKTRTRRAESIDKILTHRFWGFAAFVLFMYLIFQSVYSWSSPFMDGIDFVKGFLQGQASEALASFPQLQSLVTDGIIEGVGAFLIFLPQILILFFFISLLEETGYMARAAFLMDRLFSWSGLNGKSFVPLLSSFACAVPGILSTRTIEDQKSRIITIMIAPLMSCSARLPVYVLLIGALIEPRYGSFVAGLTLFAIHLLGVIVALPVALILRFFLKSKQSKPFLIEMPEYQIPNIRNVSSRMWNEAKEFIVRAGTIIFAITILVWAALYYPRPADLEEKVKQEMHASYIEEGGNDGEFFQALEDEESDISAALGQKIDSAYINQSYLSRFGKAVQPVFDLAGFDWRITVGILASFPAREVIVSTLGVIFSLGGEVDEGSHSLREAINHSVWTQGSKMGQPLFTIPVAFSIMVFFALCQQCGSTLAVIRSEINTKWAVWSFVYMTLLAWVGSVATYQFLNLFF